LVSFERTKNRPGNLPFTGRRLVRRVANSSGP
jgi:hypothetical protein